jgi:hypothetical protein
MPGSLSFVNKARVADLLLPEIDMSPLDQPIGLQAPDRIGIREVSCFGWGRRFLVFPRI